MYRCWCSWKLFESKSGWNRRNGRGISYWFVKYDDNLRLKKTTRWWFLNRRLSFYYRFIFSNRHWYKSKILRNRPKRGIRRIWITWKIRSFRISAWVHSRNEKWRSITSSYKWSDTGIFIRSLRINRKRCWIRNNRSKTFLQKLRCYSI